MLIVFILISKTPNCCTNTTATCDNNTNYNNTNYNNCCYSSLARHLEDSDSDSTHSGQDKPPRSIGVKKLNGLRDRINDFQRKRQRSSSGSKTKKKTKNRNSRRISEESSDEDGVECTHRPPSQAYIQSQKQQRIDNHPNSSEMAPKLRGGRGAAGSVKRTSRSVAGMSTASNSKRNKQGRDDESECNTTITGTLASGTTSSGPNIDHLWKKIQQWTEELVDYNGKKKPMPRNVGDMTHMEAHIQNAAKKHLFKITKFTDKDKLYNHTKITIKLVNPSDLVDFINANDPELLRKAYDVWIKRYNPFVRMGLNARHNDLKSSLMKAFEEMTTDWNPNGLPETGEEMEKLAFRLGCTEGKDEDWQVNIQKLMAASDILLPKVRQLSGWGSKFGSSASRLCSAA